MNQTRKWRHNKPNAARFLWSTLFLLVCHGAALAAEEVAISAAEISAEINAKGAKAVITRLSSAHVNAMGQSDWSRTMDQIWNGRVAFIALAPKLAQGADGKSAEDLSTALARALPAAPEAVLRVIDRRNGPVLGVGRICAVPFAEPSSQDTSGYLRAAQSAVDDVDTPRLQHVRAACLDQLALAARQLDPRPGK
ncbi:MAG TPA: hypothetical protein VHX39_27890 [Acetobacteraceae bacterium]|nr:hypothetical protein [Acetobacteraceae bacterium]